MSAAVAAPIAIAVPVATLAYLVFRRRARGAKGDPKAEDEQPPAATTTIATKEEDYGDLDSIVSFSSRVIAAARAVEHERPDAFIRDPLAEALAGEKAMRVARQRVAAAAAAAAASAEAAATPAPPPSPEPRAVPRLVMRTAFLDDAVLVAASGGATAPPAAARRLLSTPKAADALAPLAEHVRAHASSPGAPPVHNLQVVLLGAGMDARPWRLPLPPGRVRWIEVDRADVIAAKKRALAAIGAEVPDASSARPPSSSAASPPPPLVTPPPQMQQQRPAPSSSSAAAAAGAAGPYAAAAASAPTSASAAAAPRPAAPVSIRSLQRSQSAAAAAAALAAASDAAAAGSDAQAAPAAPPQFKFPLKASAWRGVAADLTKPGWTRQLTAEAGFDKRVPTLWIAEGLLYYLDPATVPDMLLECASVSAAGSALVATVITDATLEAMRGGGGGKDAGGGGGKGEENAGGGGGGGTNSVVPTTATPPPPPLSEQVLSSAPALTSQFVWGAPAGDVDGYFLRSGWRCLQRPTWSRAAAAYGWRAEKPRVGSRVPEESQVQFLVAAVAGDGGAAAASADA